MDTLKLTAATLLLLVAGHVGAQTPNVKGFYFEGTLGRTTFDVDNTSGWTLNNKDTNWGAMIGYDFNENFALEGGYRNLGEVKGSIAGTLSGIVYGSPLTLTGTLNASGDSQGWLIGPRANIPINDKFSLFGRAGIYRWDSEIKVSASAAYTWGGTAYAANESASKKYTGTDGYWGIGASYQFNPQFSGGIGFTEFRHGGDIDTKARSIELNLKVKF